VKYKMNILVAYESLFGNSRKIAEAVADGLRQCLTSADVTCARVDDIKPDTAGQVDLLIVGGPTHNMGMSSDRSRQSGVERAKKQNAQSQVETHAVGVREWAAELEKVHKAPAATFDTCVDQAFSGHASKRIAAILRAKGYKLVARPASFHVGGTLGPLAEGEITRAKAWAQELAEGNIHHETA
jgi:flavorubredoxin